MKEENKMIRVTKAKGFTREIPYDEYIEDNLLYHSMVHNLDVVTGQMDILMEKGVFVPKPEKKSERFSFRSLWTYKQSVQAYDRS